MNCDSQVTNQRMPVSDFALLVVDSGLLLTNDASNYVPFLLLCWSVIKIERTKWVAKHMDVVREVFNEHRNYVQGRCKESIELWSKAQGDQGGIPSITDILFVCLRNLPDANAPEREERERLLAIFVWWWDSFLPAVAGNTYWRATIRHAQTITSATHNGNQCIPKGTEAFAVLLYENCHDKWVQMITKSENFSKKIVIPKKKGNEETQKFAGKYSSSKLGQASYGGWSPEGKKRFNELCSLIEAARAKNHVGALEKEVLGMVRVKNNLPEEVPDEAAQASKKTRKRKRDKVVVEEVDCEMDD